MRQVVAPRRDPENVRVITSVYSGRQCARYLTCPYCGGEMHRYPRAAHPHGHRLYSRCMECNAAWWEQEESDHILSWLPVEHDRLVAA